jgi:hypothetical protein
MFADFKDTQDYGFRVYRLDDSNMQDVYYTPTQYEQGKLDLLEDNIKPDRNSDDLILDNEQFDQDLPDLKRSLHDLNSQSSENENLNNTEILPTNLNLNIQYAPPFEIFKKTIFFIKIFKGNRNIVIKIS